MHIESGTRDFYRTIHLGKKDELQKFLNGGMEPSFNAFCEKHMPECKEGLNAIHVVCDLDMLCRLYKITVVKAVSSEAGSDECKGKLHYTNNPPYGVYKTFLFATTNNIMPRTVEAFYSLLEAHDKWSQQRIDYAESCINRLEHEISFMKKDNFNVAKRWKRQHDKVNGLIQEIYNG